MTTILAEKDTTTITPELLLGDISPASGPMKSPVPPEHAVLPTVWAPNTCQSDSTITSDPNAAAIKSTIYAAIANLESRFSDPITVTINFSEMGSGRPSSARRPACGPSFSPAAAT